MTRNDTFFKILFAIEVALIPLAMSAYFLMPQWSVGLFVAGVLIAKIWLELFKNKENKTHILINAIGNVLTISSFVIFFTIYNYINVALCVFVVILAVLMNVLRVTMFETSMPETIEAVDSCYMLFECLTLASFTFVMFSQLVANIALFAIILTSVVSVCYKVFYLCKYNGLLDKVKNLFRRK